MVGALLLLAGMVVVTWLEDWRFGLAVLGFSAFFLLAQTQQFRFTTPLWQAESRARADLFGVLGEHISGNADIQKSGAISYSMRTLYETLRRRILAHAKALIIGRVASDLSYAINGIRISVGLAVGAYLFQEGDITIGTVYLVFHYLVLLGMPVITIMWHLSDLQMAAASILRVKELMDTRSRIRDGKAPPCHRASSRRVQRRVVFLHPRRERAPGHLFAPRSRQDPRSPWPYRQRQDDHVTPALPLLRS